MAKELSQREVEKYLKSHGWQLVRTKGGHNVWKSDDGIRTLAIPTHGRVSPGVVRQIIKMLPTTPESWR